ncbi:hypothetical protein BJX61DRAFT_528610 [Aspergillus egyptiacus]|nr:hypothetical protein BJX61DRAFT_528610 [Aspergillus egyptiacus]
MPHMPSFHTVPLRTSSVNAPTGEMHSKSKSRRDQKTRSMHKAQKILGTTGIALDNDYHRRPEEQMRRASFLNAPPIVKPEKEEDRPHSQKLRVRASSPLLGQEYQDTNDSTPALLELSRKLHLSGSSSALHTRSSPQASAAAIGASPPKEIGATTDAGLNPAFKQPKGPMKDSKRKTRPPRIDLSLLFPKPQTNHQPLLSPQRMVSSPSAISELSENPMAKARKPENRLPGKKLTKAPPLPRPSSSPEKNQKTLDGGPSSTDKREISDPGRNDSSMERTVRTSEMDLALEKDPDAVPTPRSPERARYDPKDFSLRSLERLGRSDDKSALSNRSGASQRTLRETSSAKSLNDKSLNSGSFRFGLRDEVSSKRGPNVSKKSSKNTLKSADLNTSSVLCLSSSEDEADEEPPFRPRLKAGKNKRDSVSTYGDFDAEICTAAAAQATRVTLRSVERPSSSNTQTSRSSSKLIQARRDLAANDNSRSRPSSGIPAILEPDFLHSDPIFDQNKVPPRTPSLSQKEINRRSRLMAVTRQEERLLEVMRQRHGKVTPSLFNEAVEPDRRSLLTASTRDSFYFTDDTSFLRLSPGLPSPGFARAQEKEKAPSPRLRPRPDTAGKSTTSLDSRPTSTVSAQSLPSPATSTTSGSSPLTPTLPTYRYSPLPIQKPPPPGPPPPVPELQRQHSRRRTDSSGAIALDDADEQKTTGSSEFPVWALGWNTERSSITAVH